MPGIRSGAAAKRRSTRSQIIDPASNEARISSAGRNWKAMIAMGGRGRSLDVIAIVLLAGVRSGL